MRLQLQNAAIAASRFPSDYEKTSLYFLIPPDDQLQSDYLLL
jgi:hypothetical protein